MPPWGRPPGSNDYKKYRNLGKQLTSGDENSIYDSEHDKIDTEGSNSRKVCGERGDILQLGEIQIAKARSGKKILYNVEDSSESDDTDSDFCALEPQEELVAQVALLRIRRARLKGKKDVKLNEEELAALEKRRKILQESSSGNSHQKIGVGGIHDKQMYRRSIAVPLSSAIVSDQWEPTRQLKKSSNFEEQSTSLDTNYFAFERPSSHISQRDVMHGTPSPIYDELSGKNFLLSDSRPPNSDVNPQHEIRSLSSRGSAHYGFPDANWQANSQERVVPSIDHYPYDINPHVPYSLPRHQHVPYRIPDSFEQTYSQAQRIFPEKYSSSTTAQVRWRGRNDERDELSL